VLNNKPNPYTAEDIRFTVKPAQCGDALYAIFMAWPGQEGTIKSLALSGADTPQGKIEKVELLGHPGPLEFKQDAETLKVRFPSNRPCDYAYSLRITGLMLGGR